MHNNYEGNNNKVQFEVKRMHDQIDELGKKYESLIKKKQE